MQEKANRPFELIEAVDLGGKTPANPFQRQRRRQLFSLTASVLLLIAFLIVTSTGWKRHTRPGYVNFLPSTARAAEIDPWTLAAEKVKEDRGEPTGRQAQVNIPQQVRHSSDTGRFLAIQVADVRQHHVETPQDFVDLAELIRRGEMAPLHPITENYILFGVGGNADPQAFTRFQNGSSIGLYNESGLQSEYARLSASRLKLVNSLVILRKELRALKKRDRSRRAQLQSQILVAEKALKVEQDNKELLDRNYGDKGKRAELFSDYDSLAKLAKNFPDRNFNIEDASERKQMKVRMLSCLRPEALRVLEEIAAAYREKFDRPLPITSLIRPDEYQQLLRRTNPNATRIDTPPHSTGLAFDIYYRFMTAGEQAHLMAHLARLKDEGRIEVLRENRDHYHVFAFIDGKRPQEFLIAASRSATSPKRTAKEIHKNERVASSLRRTSSTRTAGKTHHGAWASSSKRRARVAKNKGGANVRHQAKHRPTRKRR